MPSLIPTLRQRLSARWASWRLTAKEYNPLDSPAFTMFLSFVCVIVGLGCMMYLIALFVVMAPGP